MPQIIVCVLLCSSFFLHQWVRAATITTYSDRISTSAPSEYANHTINFITTEAIPPGGSIRFTPDDGDFTILSTNFDIDNVALYVATSSEYNLRSATGTPSVTDDGVVITTGTSGNIEITLNATDGIPADANIRLLIGSHTPNATGTDYGLTNPASIGTYAYTLSISDGTNNTQVEGRLAIVEAVSIANVDTTETIPPVRFNGAPSGDISGSSVSVEFSFETDEFARCRYSTASDTPYFSMTNSLGSSFVTVHTKVIAVVPSSSYTFFIRCIDDEGNVNTDDFMISWTTLPIPEGTPGDGDENAGGGSGSGSGTGTGGSGSGSSGGGSSGGGSVGGGGGKSEGGSGGSGGGGLESSKKPYQSGEGEVIITGYSSPQSKVVVLVDGAIAEETTSDGSGEFSMTIDAIARGAYTFGVYGVDKNGIKTSTFSTTFTVTGSRGSTLSNINVMPSIKVTPDPVQPNSTLKVSGYAIPSATITIENQNDKTSASLKSFTATSNTSGAWSVDIDTTGFTQGTYKVRAKAKQETGVSTNFSNYTYYGVGQSADVPQTSDLNRDGKVNLPDFSILLFWWGTAGGASNPPADINRDGKVSLTDFSIMIFNWTG